MNLKLIIMSLIISVQVYAEYKVVNSYFHISSLKDVKNGKVYKVSSDACEMWSDLEHSPDYILSGEIKVKLFNEETLSSHNLEIDNVKALFKFNGIYANLMADCAPNARMRIAGLSGNKISDIFDYKFRGAQLSLGAGAVVNVNPNISALVNWSGLTILDIEQFVNLGGGVDFRAGVVSLKFYRESNSNIKSTTRLQQGNQSLTKRRTLTVDEMMNIELD